MIIVAAATIYTVELLMAEASATGMHDYGTLSKAIGGTWYKVRFIHASHRHQGPVGMRPRNAFRNCHTLCIRGRFLQASFSGSGLYHNPNNSCVRGH